MNNKLPSGSYYKDGALITSSSNKILKKLDLLEDKLKELEEKIYEQSNTECNNKTTPKTK